MTLALSASAPEAQSNCVADLIIVNATVHTVDAAKPSAQALAICGASTPADHARARALLGQGVQPGEAFLGEWLAQSTRDWLAAQGVAPLRAAE